MDDISDLEDMREHVPFLASLIEKRQAELDAQCERSAQTYGTTNDSRWPACSYVQVRDMRSALAELRADLAAARELLAELEAEAVAT